MIVRRITQSTPYQRTLAFYERYERFFIPGALLLGLIIDIVTFRELRIETVLKILTIHMILAGSAIAFMHIYDAKWKKTAPAFLRYLRIVTPLVMQFTFGAMLSVAFLFYWFGGTVFVSWPFILILLILLASNEVLRAYYLRPIVQLTVYFFLLFTVGSVIFPYVLRSIDSRVFAMSGIVALAFVGGFVWLLGRVVPDIRTNRRRIFASILTVFFIMNGLYLINVLPPIPLALRDAGVYHDVRRADGAYELRAEQESLLDRLIPGRNINITEGDPVYVFTAIFAPTDLSTTIYHQWQYYDDASARWVDRDRLAFPIFGGRNEGYRGYSRKSAVDPGRWRVDVETETEQVLGRVQFRVERVNEPPAYRQITR